MTGSAGRRALAAVGFLTCLPSGRGNGRPDGSCLVWFVPVGAGIGAVVGGVWWGAGELWPPLVAAALAVTVDAALTGMLHLDGLSDSADGLLPPLDRERRLAVMADPRAGVFGVVVVVLVLMLRTGALASLAPDVWLVAGLWAASRAAMGVALATMPYARPNGGLAAAFVGTSLAPPLVGGAVVLGIVMWTAGVPDGLAAALGLVGGCAAVLGLAHRRIGGFTGDVLGAAGVIGETCGLLLAAARW